MKYRKVKDPHGKSKRARLKLMGESNKKYPIDRITGRRTKEDIIRLIPIMIKEKKEFRTPEIWLVKKYQISMTRFFKLATPQQIEEYDELQDEDKIYYKINRNKWRKR